jgi:hypothetical protein
VTSSEAMGLLFPNQPGSGVQQGVDLVSVRKMSSQEASPAHGADSIHALVLTIHEDMGGNFVQTVCPDAAGTAGHAIIDGQRYSLSVLADDPRQSSTWSQRVVKSDTLVLQVRFMDALSMDRLKAICSHLPRNPPKPMGVFLLREEGEIDFKMSCLSCGQKLWVRDTDEGKRGRCPNCKKGFRLPSQVHHAKEQLELAENVPVARITRGNPTSCRNALSNLKEHLAEGMVMTESNPDSEIPLKPTVRIDIQETARIDIQETDAKEPDTD